MIFRNCLVTSLLKYAYYYVLGSSSVRNLIYSVVCICSIAYCYVTYRYVMCHSQVRCGLSIKVGNVFGHFTCLKLT